MLRLSLPSKRNGIADVGLLFQLRLETFTPPRSLLAHFLWFQHKTFGLDDIEEQFAHQVGGRCVGLLQTRTKPFVASAVRNGNEKLVGELVIGMFAFDDVRAMIVVAAATINAAIGAQVVVIRGSVTGAAPFGAHQHHHITSMSAGKSLT